MRTISIRPLIFIFSLWFVFPTAVPANVDTLEKKEAVNIEVEDFRGKRLVFSKPVNRIVVLLDSALSGLYMLGAAEKVVGVNMTAYTGSSFPYFSALDARIKKRSLPVVSGSTAGSLERIIALRPQVVIIWAFNKELIKALEERGIVVFGVFIEDIADIYDEILAFGKFTGTIERARELINYTQRQVALVRGTSVTVPVINRPRSYFMWAKGNLDSGGRRSIIQELLEIAGAQNICGHIDQEHVVISLEYLLTIDPQMIVMWYNKLQDPADIGRQPAWKVMSAAKNNRIHELPDLFHCDLWTLNFQYSLKLIAQWTHPGLFSNLDPQQEQETIFRVLYGIDLPRQLLCSFWGNRCK